MDRARKTMESLLTEHTIVVALFLFWMVLWLTNPAFSKFTIFATIIKEASIYAVCGIGMTFAIISGDFDLSVASQIALSSVVFTSILSKISPSQPGMGMILTCLVILALGVLMGLVNGLLIARVRIPAFITTLAMQKIYRGVAQLVNKDPVPIITLGEKYLAFTTGTGKAVRWELGKLQLFYGKGFVFTKILGLPLFFYLMILLAVLGVVVLRKTRLGRYILSIGNSKEAARIAGINIARTQVITYVMVGLFTALSALMMTANQGSSNYGVPVGTEFTVISAVVLGGTALAGGKGSILNTVVAALFISTISMALTTFGVDSTVHGIFSGIILVFAFSINTIRSIADEALVKRRARKERTA